METFRYLAEQSKPTPFEAWVRVAETWARDVLTKAGHKANKLDYASSKILWVIADEADKAGKADSDEDFAARILMLIFEVREAIKSGNACKAAMDGVRLGELVGLHDTKMQHEPTWGTGDKQRRALKGSRDTENARRRNVSNKASSRWNEEAAKIWKGKPHLSKAAVARLVKSNLRPIESEKTISRKLRKPGQAG